MSLPHRGCSALSPRKTIKFQVIPNGLAIDSADNLFVANFFSGSILKFTPSGVRTTFATRIRYSYGFPAKSYGFPAKRCGKGCSEIDFNGDGHPDYVLRNANHAPNSDLVSEQQHLYQGGAFGPANHSWLDPGGCAADFNRDVHPDYALVQFHYRSNRDLVYVRANTHRSRGTGLRFPVAGN